MAEDGLASFMAFTGASPAEAGFYLDSSGGNLEMAVQLYFSGQQSATPNAPQAAVAPGMPATAARMAAAGSASSAAVGKSVYSLECLQSAPMKVFKIVEDDRFGQYPFIYVILGFDKCVVVDTGCGCGNLRAFLDSQVNTKNLPYLVFLSHVHFDHIGGAWSFCNTVDGSTNLAPGVNAIVMGNANRKFSENFELTSLAQSHGTHVKPFHVSCWCDDGQLFWLNDAQQSIDTRIEVLHTPGHSSDSISIFVYPLDRMFVADSLYPFTLMDHGSVGNSVSDYYDSLQKLRHFLLHEVPSQRSKATACDQSVKLGSVEGGEGKIMGGEGPVTSSQDGSSWGKGGDIFLLSRISTEAEAIQCFRRISSQQLHLPPNATRSALLREARLCKDRLPESLWTRAVAKEFNIALKSFPPRTTEQGAFTATRTAPQSIVDLTSSAVESFSCQSPETSAPEVVDLTDSSRKFPAPRQERSDPKLVVGGADEPPTGPPRLCCGHVEANLEIESIDVVINLLDMVRSGALPPSRVEDGNFGEWTAGKFNILLPMSGFVHT